MLTEALMLSALSIQVPGPAMADFLRDRFGFSDSDVSRVYRGEVVTRKLDSSSDREVALVGVVRVGASRARFVAEFEDVESFMTGEAVVRVGSFGDPPALSDLAALSLSDEDIEALRSCRVGDCDVKLSAERIEQIGSLDWSAPDDRARLERMGRGWLLEYMNDYLRRGNAALVVYDDRDTPQPLHDGFHALLSESQYVLEYAPELHHYLDRYPELLLPEGRDLFFWSVQDVGLKPITTLTHATAFPRSGGGAGVTRIALKQIYASHYFHAALGLMTLVDAAESGESIYLVYLDRALFDTKIGWPRRGAIEGRLEDRLRGRLGEMRGRFAPGRTEGRAYDSP